MTIRRLFSTYRPLQYFGIIAAILVILAAAFFLPILITFFKTGYVPNFPTLIVCGFAVIAAIQSFFAGLILSNIHQKNLREFEIELYKADIELRKNTI